MKLSLLLLFIFGLFAVFGDETPVEDATATEEYEDEGYKTGDAFTAEQRATLEDTSEKHEFQAEVSRLMDIIINSLYSNKEIFLRELISNSADALDKVRFLSLTDESILADAPELEIRLSADADTKTITITDTGVGMTKEHLQKHLGVVAKSGTSEFLDAAKSGQDAVSLIGQFGVGFYSVYLVAEKVTVVSKHHDDVQHIWESTAQSVYTVAPDPRGNTLGRGTQITIHLKDDAEEFLDNKLLTSLVTRYSQFINFPIYLREIETITKEVPKEPEAKEEKEEKEDDDIEVSEEEEEAEAEMETIEEEVENWKKLNEARPLWTKNPADVSEQEYEDFYKQLTKDTDGPMEKMHFVAEGEISFRALLYIPKKLDQHIYDKYYSKSTNLKLYVRRVLISDEFEDFLPRYMNFVKGVVDSDDLPLNVSRETLAESRVLKVMSKKLTRKVLEMLRKIADRSERVDDEGDDEDEEGERDDEDTNEDPEEETDYEMFWKNYGKSIKMGIMDDQKNKSKLTKLLRFQTTKSKGKLTSFEEYVDRMQEGQNNIWYLTGESYEKIMANPVLEGFLKRDIEVILYTESVDEYAAQYIHEFDGVEPKNAAKQGTDPWKLTKAFEDDKEQAEDLAKWLKDLFGDAVKKVEHSAKLMTTAAVITSTEYGSSANYERVQASQSLSVHETTPAEKNFEFNWRHPIIKKLDAMVREDPESELAKEVSWMLFQSSQIYSGYVFHDGDEFAKRINRIVAKGLSVNPEAEAEAEDEDDVDDEEPNEGDLDDDDIPTIEIDAADLSEEGAHIEL